jgi:hypothetical protein
MRSSTAACLLRARWRQAWSAMPDASLAVARSTSVSVVGDAVASLAAARSTAAGVVGDGGGLPCSSLLNGGGRDR